VESTAYGLVASISSLPVLKRDLLKLLNCLTTHPNIQRFLVFCREQLFGDISSISSKLMQTMVKRDQCQSSGNDAAASDWLLPQQ